MNKTVFWLCGLAVGMFGFALYGLPPLYDAFCEWTGLNGKGGLVAAENIPTQVVEDRQVRVTFIATNNEQMPWEFKPNDAVMIVKPGEVVDTTFYAKNTTDKDMVSRAIPSFVPSTSAEFFNKVECFCFDNQPLKAGESANMGIQFYVDAELPKSISNITLSYTIFDITESVAEAEPVNELTQR